jgi:hypothetical protein
MAMIHLIKSEPARDIAPAFPRLRVPWQRECHYCGYEPEDFFAPPARCPKCGGSAWQAVFKAGGLLSTRPRGLSRLRGIAANN